GKSAIILVPEIVHIKQVASFIREISGERLCVLHSGLSKGQRSEAMEKIISGQCNVVLGTRMAVFAPLKNVSLISVMQEHSSSYRTEEGLRFSARDIAVMRGYLEKAVVVLSSVCPSIESVYNSKRNKYTLIKPDVYSQRPKIRILNMRNERQPAPNLSKTVINEALSSIRKNEKIMFVINRKGYSMLTCKECGHTETCGKCSIPLMFYKGDKSLRCHYCGAIASSPEKCRRCGGFSLEPTGSGIERVEENIKKIFNIEPLRIDSDRIKRKRIPEDISDITEGKSIILGTKLLTKRLHSSEKFGMAAVLNADSYLNQPDFRSAERTFHELYSITDKIKPGGSLFIQTRMPQNYIFRHLKNHDYDSFCNEELEKRKEMLYPPFSKLTLITFNGRDCDTVRTEKAIREILSGNKALEVLGPSVMPTKKGGKEYSLLFKAVSKKNLHSSVKRFLELLGSYKCLNVKIAIDP
ncbi:MAG: primosomal protein N', partial [Nitrospirae bacterium]|nr:primosomal protein N' [Nitrospirota bacterium]